MGESAKAVLALVVIVGLVGSLMAWWTMDTVNWPARLGFPTAGLASLGLLLWAVMRRDKAPDFLRQVAGSYFENGGFCFAIVPAIRERTYRLDIYYQNRYERPCRARVIMQPSLQFFLNRRPIGSITVAIECGGGSFGVASVPWAVPGAFQGKKQSFDIGADVKYPLGHGAMLRYRDGLQVGGANEPTWVAITTLAGALGGILVLYKPAKCTFELPSDVEETVPEEAPILFETLWRPGDPPNEHGKWEDRWLSR